MRRNLGDIATRFERERTPSGKPRLIPSRSRIVGGKETRCAIAIIHFPQVRCSCHDVVARIEGIAAERKPVALARPGSGHQLHQSPWHRRMTRRASGPRFRCGSPHRSSAREYRSAVQLRAHGRRYRCAVFAKRLNLPAHERQPGRRRPVQPRPQETSRWSRIAQSFASRREGRDHISTWVRGSDWNRFARSGCTSAGSSIRTAT